MANFSTFQDLGDIMPLDALWPIELKIRLAWDAGELAIYFDQSFALTSDFSQQKVKPLPCSTRGVT